MVLTCGDLIKRGRALYARQPALLFEGRQFTFAEQAARMFRLANALIAQGVRKQERVALLEVGSDHADGAGPGRGDGLNLRVSLCRNASSRNVASH